MNKKKVKIIVTLGPSTRTEADLWKLKDKISGFLKTVSKLRLGKEKKS